MRRKGNAGAAVALISFLLSFLAIPFAHAQIEIRALRLIPNPQSFDSDNWFLVDFEKGEIQDIELTTKYQSRHEMLKQTTNPVPVPKSLVGKESGTLKLSYFWRQRDDAEDQRTIVVQLTDKNKHKAFIGSAFLPTHGWQATSPIKLLRTANDPPTPKIDGSENSLRIFYQVTANARPDLLYVETQYDDGSKDLHEIKLQQEDRASGETRWKWQATKRGECKLRIWLVDENKNQTNPIEMKLAM
jgi:hypothetical protein